jgi:uncharacterized membrane protein
VKHEMKTANKVMWMLIGVIGAVTLVAFYLLSLRANGRLYSPGGAQNEAPF